MRTIPRRCAVPFVGYTAMFPDRVDVAFPDALHGLLSQADYAKIWGQLNSVVERYSSAQARSAVCAAVVGSIVPKVRTAWRVRRGRGTRRLHKHAKSPKAWRGLKNK